MLFGDRLKMLREDKDITQKELGNSVGVSDRVIGYYESNDRFPKDENTLKSLADYFNVSVDYLLGRTEIKNQDSEWKPSLSDKDNKDLDKIVESFEKGLSGDIMLDGEILDDATKELLLKSVRNAYEFAKINNKAKYTPKKYRK